MRGSPVFSPTAPLLRLAKANRLSQSSIMITHDHIDDRSLLMAQAIVDRIDRDPERKGLDHARAVCRRWLSQRESPAVREWDHLLQNDWPAIRAVLLDPSDEGKRRRQSHPFCGILTPRERWAIYRKTRVYETT